MSAPELKNKTTWQGLVETLPLPWMQNARWFRHKADPIRRIALHDGLDLSPYAAPAASPIFLLILEVEMESGRRGLYQVPVAIDAPGAGEPGAWPLPHDAGLVREAVGDPAFHTAVCRLMAEGSDLRGRRGAFRFERYTAKAPFQSRPLAQTSSNTLVLVKRDDVVKYLRGLEPGVSPELEMNRFFAGHGDFVNLPPLTGAVSYLDDDGTEFTLAIALRFIENQGDLWEWTQAFLRGFLDALPAGDHPLDDDALAASAGDYLRQTERLADVLAQMHDALQGAPAEPAFAPQPIVPEDLQAWSSQMTAGASAIFDRTARLAPGEGPLLQAFFEQFPQLRERTLAAFAKLPALAPAGWLKCRVHGDFHLGQALKTSDDFIIMDFEGEPLKEQRQRVARYSPLKDVAGLLRSYNYAAYAALFAWMERQGVNQAPPRAEAAVLQWCTLVERVFRDRYFRAARLTETADLSAFLAVLKLEKAVYELDYEINNRPDWLRIPVSGIGACLKEVFANENR